MTDPKPKFDEAPDYAYWCRMAVWEWEKSVTLSLGRDPAVVTYAAVQSEDCPADLRQKYLKRHTLIDSHVKAGWLPYLVDPAIFVSWAKANGFNYPPELEKAVTDRGGKIANWKHKFEQLSIEHDALKAKLDKSTSGDSDANVDKPLRDDARASLLKLVIGMATGRYEYDPDARRSTVPKVICGDVNLCGHSIDEDTVRKWLGEAAKLSQNKDG